MEQAANRARWKATAPFPAGHLRAERLLLMLLLPPLPLLLTPPILKASSPRGDKHSSSLRVKHRRTSRGEQHLLTEADVAAQFPGGSFMASWNEPFTVHAGDWLCMPHPDGGECYRIEAGAFASTYRLDGS